MYESDMHNHQVVNLTTASNLNILEYTLVPSYISLLKAI